MKLTLTTYKIDKIEMQLVMEIYSAGANLARSRSCGKPFSLMGGKNLQ